MGFEDSDTTWQQVWLLNRLGYIEGAENMSYEIPGIDPNIFFLSISPICLVFFQ